MTLTREEQERLEFLGKLILTLEWDRASQQLNPGMEAKLPMYIKERDELLEKKHGTEKVIKA